MPPPYPQALDISRPVYAADHAIFCPAGLFCQALAAGRVEAMCRDFLKLDDESRAAAGWIEVAGGTLVYGVRPIDGYFCEVNLVAGQRYRAPVQIDAPGVAAWVTTADNLTNSCSGQRSAAA